jgi:hypothetical protein
LEKSGRLGNGAGEGLNLDEPVQERVAQKAAISSSSISNVSTSNWLIRPSRSGTSLRTVSIARAMAITPPLPFQECGLITTI